MAKKRSSTSRAQRVAVGIGRVLGSVQARLDRLKGIKRAQPRRSAAGPDVSGDDTSQRERKVTKKTAKPRSKLSTAKKSTPGIKKK